MAGGLMLIIEGRERLRGQITGRKADPSRAAFVELVRGLCAAHAR